MRELFIFMMISTVLSFMITPFIRKIAITTKVISIPKDERNIHKKPIPLLGGLGIYISFMLLVILKPGPLSSSEKGILIGATFIIIGGLIDDAMEIKPWQKLLFQFAASLSLIYYGVTIKILTNPFFTGSPYFNIGLLYIPFTLIWIIGVTNAFNLIDGLDGLAAGIALISCVTIFIIAIMNNRNDAAVFTAILSGAILGFLPYNFNPASIFLGDTGSQLLGFLLAAISIEGAIKSAAAFAIAVPILALGLPIYDTIFAMVRRKINGKPMMQADRGHLHHRLLDMGLTQRQAVIIMYLISAVLGGIAIIAMQCSSSQAYFLLAVVMIVIISLAWKFGIFSHKE
jgi:UDP-GlcNAc:undecaprenyl-phosphate GlcNAc-1-phosphate transferase